MIKEDDFRIRFFLFLSSDCFPFVFSSLSHVVVKKWHMGFFDTFCMSVTHITVHVCQTRECGVNDAFSMNIFLLSTCDFPAKNCDKLTDSDRVFS